MAQQAMPKVSGHSADLRLQLMTLSAVVKHAVADAAHHASHSSAPFSQA